MNEKAHKTLRRSLLASFLALNVIALVALVQTQVVGAVLSKPETTKQNVALTPITSSSFPAVHIGAAIDARKEMLERAIRVTFVNESGAEPISSFDLALKDHPLWIMFNIGENQSEAVIDLERVRQHLISYPPQNIPEPQSCVLLSTWVDNDGVTRAQTDCIAKSGFIYDQNKLANMVKEAFEKGQDTVEYVLTSVPAVVTDPTNGSAMPMKLLATGHSSFEGSGVARKSNVRKGLNERVHNVLVPADTVFSFNDTLGIVSINRGWKEALTIFEGVNLRPAPGGGICQVSTTTYRAALAAGLPIVQQKSHSLYVTYYEKFGVGQDATIFPGKQDFQFRNDTGAPILIQAYNQGDEAFVRIYGSDDGRNVAITGPYFGKTAPKDLLENGKILRNNEIAWVRTVRPVGGEQKREVFIARYQAIPKSLSSRWELTTKITRGEMTKDIVASEQ